MNKLSTATTTTKGQPESRSACQPSTSTTTTMVTGGGMGSPMHPNENNSIRNIKDENPPLHDTEVESESFHGILRTEMTSEAISTSGCMTTGKAVSGDNGTGGDEDMGKQPEYPPSTPCSSEEGNNPILRTCRDITRDLRGGDDDMGEKTLQS